MNIYTENSTIIKNKKSVVTIGTFDGVHKGHLDILDHVIQKAEEIDGRSFVITFKPHPRTIIAKKDNIFLLTTYEEKIELLKNRGIENLLIINFTKEFSNLTAKEFVDNIICNKIGAAHLVIGYDHKFGKDRVGDQSRLTELGIERNFTVSTVAPVEFNGEIISSTKIRMALFDGNIQKANNFLGRNYSIEGKVVEGTKRGRIIGFPTANIEVENKLKLVPKNGVYAVKVFFDSMVYFGIMNIGVRPTFEDLKRRFIEVYILNFSGNIYDKKIKVEFLKRIRDEKKFSSKEELIKQIKDDKKNVEEYKLINSG